MNLGSCNTSEISPFVMFLASADFAYFSNLSVYAIFGVPIQCRVEREASKRGSVPSDHHNHIQVFPYLSTWGKCSNCYHSAFEFSHG
jgi:hypothetical protein